MSKNYGCQGEPQKVIPPISTPQAAEDRCHGVGNCCRIRALPVRLPRCGGATVPPPAEGPGPSTPATPCTETPSRGGRPVPQGRSLRVPSHRARFAGRCTSLQSNSEDDCSTAHTPRVEIGYCHTCLKTRSKSWRENCPMKAPLALLPFAAAIMVASISTSHAVTLQGDRSCTERPPICDPEKKPLEDALKKEMFELCTDEEGCHSDA